MGNFWNAFIDMFTTRDFAIITWVFAIIGFFLLNKNSRNQTLNFLKVLLAKTNNRLFWVLSAYFGIITLVFHYVGTRFGEWDYYMVKDAALWFLFSGLPINIKYIKEEKYFGQLKDTVMDNFKVALLFDCVFSTYTFSYAAEMFMVLVIICLGYTMLRTENKEEHRNVNIAIKGILMMFGFMVVMYVFYMTGIHHNEIFSKLVLTELSQPFFYTCCFILSAITMKHLLKDKKYYHENLDNSFSVYATKIEKFDIIHFFFQKNNMAFKLLFNKLFNNSLRTDP